MKAKIYAVVSLVFLIIMVSGVSDSHVARAVESGPAIVYVDPPSIISSGPFFNVTVKTDNVNPSPGMQGLQFKLTWDPAVLEGVEMIEVMFHNVTPPSEWDNIWQLKLELNNTEGLAFYGVTWQDNSRATNAGYAPISGNHTIAIITFQVKSTGNCTLHLLPWPATRIGDPEANDLPQGFITIDGFVKTTLPGDLNGDDTVNIIDVMLQANAFGTTPEDTKWNPNADINGDGRMSVLDTILLCGNFGRKS